MNNLAVNAADGTLYPSAGIDSQSIYEYFAGNERSKSKLRTTSVCFVGEKGEFKRPYRVYNRSLDEVPKYPYLRMMPEANILLTAWRSHNDKEPIEFETLDLTDMSKDNIAWLRANGELTNMAVNKAERLLAMAYRDESWRIDIRRTNNFQLREVVHHPSPIIGLFFHKEMLVSLSNKLIVSYPEARNENCLLNSNSKVIGWAHHPTEPYMVIIEADRYYIVDLDKLRVVKKAEWTEQIKWFNLLRKYSNQSTNMQVKNCTAAFSKDGNRFLLGGYGKIAVFDWHDMLRPRCVQPKPENVVCIYSDDFCSKEHKGMLDAHITDIVPLNRDKLLCVTSGGYMTMANIRTQERNLLLSPGNGVRINSIQLSANGKRLAMAGYYYGIDGKGGCKVESALLIWKVSRLLSKASLI